MVHTLHPALKLRPHQWPVKKDNPFPCPAGSVGPDAPHNMVGLPHFQGTVLTHVQLAVNWDPQILFLYTVFQLLDPKLIAPHGVVVIKVQDPTLSLVKAHTVDLSPLIQPVQIPL